MSRLSPTDFEKQFIGKKFNFLTILKRAKDKNGYPAWLALCDCGGTKIVYVQHIKNGQPKSCGCPNFRGPSKNRKYDEKESSFRAKVSDYKSSAKRRKLEFNLTVDETMLLLKSNCYYCGSSPSNTGNVFNRNVYSEKLRIKNEYRRKNFEIKYNGIDRIDNLKGYMKNNVVACCFRCNSAKNNSNYEDFINWINNLIKYRTSL